MKITLDEIERGEVQGALDTLACALATHEHLFTDGERAVYERASQILGTTCGISFAPADGGEEDDGGEAWKQ